jgi:hypothetical protein
MGVASEPAEQEMIMNQVTLTAEAFSKATRDVAAFGRGNLEAVAQSTQAYVQATQELSRQALALAQELNTQAIEGTKALAGAKSLKEAADIQAVFARAAFDRLASEGSRLQQAALHVIERAFVPLTQRATAAAPQTARPLAA